MPQAVLKLSQLRSFLALADELSFRKAAECLYLSQPALSKQIKALEVHLQADLFDRKHSEVTLTPAGLAIRESASSLLQRATKLPAKIAAAAAASGEIVVGVGMSLEQTVQRVERQHQRAHPGVRLLYRELSSTVQCDALQTREIDVAFLWPPVPKAYLVTQPLFKRRFVAVLSNTHSLAKQKKIALADLAGERLILRSRKSGRRLYEPVLILLRKAGIKTRTLISDLSPQFAIDVHVASNQGICVLPEKIVRPHRNFKIIPIAEAEAFHTVNIAWRRNEQSPRILNFVDGVRRLFSA